MPKATSPTSISSGDHDMWAKLMANGTLLLGIERGARGMCQPFASVKSCKAMVVTMLGQEDRDKIVRGLPHIIAVANKTGELPQVRHDAAIVDPFGARPYILVVLEKGLRDQTQGVLGINRISRAIYDLYRNREPR